MMATANLAARLAETIGVQRVVAAAEELAAYAVDGMAPGAIVRPASAEEVAKVVRFAVAEKLAVLPFGSRSKCEMGMSPARYDIAVDMTGLREIAHYDAGDLTLSVDAGMPLRELEIYLQRKGQFLPLAVPCFERSTVGGAIASGIDSALRQHYGSARDILIGAEFVDGTGQVCKSGGRVVKNVTGYDLHKLLIGSLGTLGIITRLNFRTYPAPAAYGGHVASFDRPESALAYRNAVEASGLPVANLEMLNPNMARIAKAILEKEDGPVPGCVEAGSWSVYVSYEGSESVVERLARDLERLAKEAGAARDELLDAGSDSQLGSAAGGVRVVAVGRAGGGALPNYAATNWIGGSCGDCRAGGEALERSAAAAGRGCDLFCAAGRKQRGENAGGHGKSGGGCFLFCGDAAGPRDVVACAKCAEAAGERVGSEAE